MEVFDRKVTKGDETAYIARTNNLEDLGEDERKDCVTIMYLFELMRRYPKKADELNKVVLEINKLKENCFENAEDLLKLYGMDQILTEIFKVLEDE